MLQVIGLFVTAHALCESSIKKNFLLQPENLLLDSKGYCKLVSNVFPLNVYTPILKNYLVHWCTATLREMIAFKRQT